MTNRKFSTGSVRDSIEGKPRMVMIPPAAMVRLGMRFGEGSGRYGDWNAHLGQPITALLDSKLRHTFAFLAGDTSEDHVGAMLWGDAMIAHTLDLIDRGLVPAELDDRPDYASAEWRERILAESRAIREAVTSDTGIDPKGGGGTGSGGGGSILEPDPDPDPDPDDTEGGGP